MTRLKSEKGYLLMSTLFFLLFSGLFAQSMVKIAGNHLIQLRQLTTAYEAKSTVNMSAQLLLQEIAEDQLPEEGLIKTSNGDVIIKSKANENETLYELTLTTNNGLKYSKEITVTLPEPEVELEEDPEEIEEISNESD